MKILNIEWRHFEKEGETCLRCADTGASLRNVVVNLTDLVTAMGLEVTVTETMLSAEELAQSNMILFNGVPLEDLLPKTVPVETSCASCSCLTGKEVNCRAIEYESRTLESIPEDLIRAAALKAIEITDH